VYDLQKTQRSGMMSISTVCVWNVEVYVLDRHPSAIFLVTKERDGTVQTSYEYQIIMYCHR
jgi:hypothetical protein